MKKEVDHIIVGQGIAGTALASHLLDRGEDVMVIDNHHARSSSLVAAGKWNPIVFKKLNKSWMIDTLLPFAVDFYRKWERSLGEQFLHFHENVRLFSSPGEQNMWFEKEGEPGFEEYISLPAEPPLSLDRLNAPHGGGVVHKGGHVDLPNWLGSFRRMLNDQGRLMEKELDYKDIDLRGKKISVDGVVGNRLIFCQGHQSNFNPWFEELPLKDTKGELIIIQSPELKLENVISRGLFILPMGNDHYTVGATFKWNANDNQTTSEAREELVKKLRAIVNVEFEVVEQKAGVRPSSGDRRPIMGWHPKDDRIGILNGFGAKGVVLAPYWADQFALNITENADIPKVVNLNRFKGW